MDKRQIKLQLRNMINKITGKQSLIDEFYSLSIQLCELSDKTPTGTPMKEQLKESLDSILERKTISTRYGFYMDSYSPYEGDNATTQKKINELKTALNKFHQMQKMR